MKRFIHLNLCPSVVGTILIIAAAGCGRDTVKVYHVDTSDDVTQAPTVAISVPPVMASNSMTMPTGLPAPDNSGQPKLKYVLPEGWLEKRASQMRVASFGVSENGKQADISVVPLGGMAGGDFANVNRWRGQVGLPPQTDGEIAALAEKIMVAGQPGDLYDISGGGQRILAVILHREDTAWFFKVTGDAGLVEKQKPAFVSFLKSLSFVSSTMPSPMPGTSLGTQNSLFPNSNTLVIGGIDSSNSAKNPDAH